MLDYRLARECRRRRLLSLLGREVPGCSGCDVCDGTAVFEPPGEREAIAFVRRNRRRFTEDEAALILSGTRDFRSITRELPGTRGFGALRGFSEDDARTALQELRIRGGIRRLSRFPGKGRLTVPPPGGGFFGRNVRSSGAWNTTE